eukprot:scaffold846_cov168-Amphora_coffeaeformis.AAC.7
MTYGSGNDRFWPLSEDADVVAHELTHGVTQFSSRLIYRNESGALNEAWSDIFGALVDRHAGARGEDIWTIGEDITKEEGDVIRNMGNPYLQGHFGYYPSRYQGEADNGGVHWNSGIANLAFKLLLTGGRHPKAATRVRVIGLIDIFNDDEDLAFALAGQVFYCANSQCLTRHSTFEDARYCTATICGSTGIPEDPLVMNSIHTAWYAVGVGDDPSLGTVTTAPTPFLGEEYLTDSPSGRPVEFPTKQPTLAPSLAPTTRPTSTPTKGPTRQPSPSPTTAPSNSPTSIPTRTPTPVPSASPTPRPTLLPTPSPTGLHSSQPSLSPTRLPTVTPTFVPTKVPTIAPTQIPTKSHTSIPSTSPTAVPSSSPSKGPTFRPTYPPSLAPTERSGDTRATQTPTVFGATANQPPPMTQSPTYSTNGIPTLRPTPVPSTVAPAESPSTLAPTNDPTTSPSTLPPTIPPTEEPTALRKNGAATTTPSTALPSIFDSPTTAAPSPKLEEEEDDNESPTLAPTAPIPLATEGPSTMAPSTGVTALRKTPSVPVPQPIGRPSTLAPSSNPTAQRKTSVPTTTASDTAIPISLAPTSLGNQADIFVANKPPSSSATDTPTPRLSSDTPPPLEPREFESETNIPWRWIGIWSGAAVLAMGLTVVLRNRIWKAEVTER